MKIIPTLKKLTLTLVFLSLKLLSMAQSNHTVTFTGSTSDFNAAEQYSSVDNVDYFVTYDATYIYFGAFRTGGNTWGAFDHFTIYLDHVGTGAGSATGVNWDGNTPTGPFASDYRVAIRNNSSGESFFSTYSGSWTTGAANAQGWNQYTTASADGALEVRIPWSDIGSPDAIRFYTYASYNTGYFGYAPSGTSGVGPSAGSQWFGSIGTKSADCIPTNTTGLTLTGTGTLTNTVPAAAGTYARVIVNAGTVTNANAWTLAPGGILEVTGGTFAIGAQTITFGNAASSVGKGTTINTSGAGAMTTAATSVLTFGGEGNIIGNNLSTNGTIRILNKFTPLAAGGLTFNSASNLDIRNGGYVNTNAPTYAAGANLLYNSGAAYTAGAEWIENITSGVGVPSNVSVGNLVASSQVDFGAVAQFRQLTGNLTLSATATIALSTSIGGDLQIGGSVTNTAGSVFTHNSRAVTFNGTVAQNLSSTAITYAYLIISNTSANVTSVANATIANDLTIDANARLNIGATTLNITGATSAINGFLRSVGTITGASAATLTFNNGGTYEHNYINGGAVPTANWNAGSTCSIIGFTTATIAPTNLAQNFSNFTWNSIAQSGATPLASTLTTILGDFSIISTGSGSITLSSIASTVINVGGNFVQSAGNCNISTALTTMNVAGDLLKTGGILTITSSTTAAQLNITGNFNQSLGTTTVSSGASGAPLMTVGADFTISGGTFTVATAASTATLNVTGNVLNSGGTLLVTASTTAAQLNVTGNYSQNAGITTVSSAASGTPLMNVTGNFDISGGTFNVSTGASTAVLNVTGTTSNTGGTLVVSASTGAAQLNANGNYTQNAGTTNISTGANNIALFNVIGHFTVSGGTFTKTLSAANMGTVNFNGTLNQNIDINNPANITGTVSFRLNNPSGITILNGSTLPINSAARLTLVNGAITLAGSGTMAYDAVNSTLIYNYASNVTTSDGEWPATNQPVNVIIGNTALSNTTLHASRTLPTTGVLTINANNRLVLDAFNLTINNTASVAIVPAIGAVTQMVVAEGTGKLIRSIATGIAYTWPIGEQTGTIEYTPVILVFTASSTARDIGFNVTDDIHPQMNNPDPQAHYRTRYFEAYNSAGGTYTYYGSFGYMAADNIGTLTNIKLNAYTGASWNQAPLTNNQLAATLGVTIAAPLSQITMPIVTGYQFVGRSTPQVYEWIPVTGTQSFAVAANWSPARNVLSFDDILSFPNGGTSVANAVTSQFIGKIIMSNNTTVALLPSIAATLTLTGLIGDDLDIPAGSSLTLGGAPSTVLLNLAHAAAAGNVATINGTLGISTNTGISSYIATNSTTNVNGTLNNNGSLVTTTSTTNINGIYNLQTVGATTSTAATLFFTSGSVYNHNRNTGIVPVGAWDLNSTCSINGITTVVPTGLLQTFGNFTWNATGQSAALVLGAAQLTNVTGNLSFLSTNNQFLSISSTASTLNVGGNLLIDVNTGTIRLTSVNVAYNLNLSGNFSLTSGNYSRLAGAAVVTTNFVNPSATQTVSQTAGTCVGIMNWNVGNGTTTNTVQLLTDFNLGGAASPFLVRENASLDCGIRVLSGSTAAFTLSNTLPGATLITANTAGIELTGATGSIQTTGARVYSANANYTYNGIANQNTGAGLTAANELTISNAAHVDLSVSANVSGNLNFTAGRLILGSSDITLANAAAAPVTGTSATSYVQTNGTGQLFRAIATAGLPINYLFPVGDGNYSPVSLNFSANNTVRNIGTIVTAGAVPFNLPSADYINRSWTFTNSAAGTYTYIPTYTYNAGDVVGTAANMKISRYDGPLWTEYTTTVTPPDMVTTASLNETTGALSSYWTGRLYAAPVAYTWNGATSNNWNTATNWTPNGIPGIIDNVTIGTAAINPCVANGVFFGANNFTLNGTGNFTLAANTELTINGTLTYINTATATFICSSILNVSSLAAQTIPALNYGSLNLAGGNRTLPNGGTVGICGSYTEGAGVITITNNTINYNATSTQTIAAATYNNLIISNNRGGATLTLEPGTITVNGVFTASLLNYTAFVDGNTFHFNGGAAQGIPAFYYFNITSAAATRVWANSGIIDVKGTFTPPATGNTITGSTVRFSSTLPGIIIPTYTTNVGAPNARNFNNVIFDGVGGTWSFGAANLRVDGTLVVNNGTVNVATTVASILIVDLTTTINGGVLNLTSSTGICTGTFTGATTVNGGSLNNSNGTGVGAGTSTFTGAITVNGGIFAVANGTSAGTMTVNNNITVAGGTFKMSNSSGAGIVTLNGSARTLAVTTGAFTKAAGAGTFNFNFTGFAQNQNFSQGATATMSGNTTFQCTGTTTLCNLNINSNLNLGAGNVTITSGYTIDMNQFVVTSTGQFRVNNGARFRTQHADGISLAPAATGCIQTSTRILGGSALWTFEGSGPQRSGNGFPRSVDQISIANGANTFTLDVTLRIQNSISWSGHIILGNNNLHIGYHNPVGPVNYTPGFTGSASKFVITNGTGMLVKYFNGASGSYTFPIGDNTGAAEYSPVFINVNSLSGGRDSIGFRVTDAQHPSDFSTTNYLSRYWSCGMISSASYNYTATFTYQTADVVGVENDIQLDRWSNPLGTWTQDATSSVNIGTNVMSSSSLNATTGTLLNNDFAGRTDQPYYYQTATSGPWSDPNTWEVSTDPLFVSPAGSTPIVAPDALTTLGVRITNGNNVTVTASTDGDNMIIDAGGILTINSGQTFTVANGTGTDLSVSGAINNAGTMVTTGTVEFNNGSGYDHQQNGGVVPTATWNNGSTCQITGVVNTVPTGLNQTFYDFGWNCSSQNSDIQLAGLLTTVTNDFSLTSTGSPANDLRLFDNTNTGTLNIGTNLNITGGILALINSGSSAAGVATVNVNGNLTISAGGIDMTGASANTAAGSNLNIKGDVSITGTGTISRTQNVPSIITLNKTTGNQQFSTATNGINISNILWRIGDGITTNIVDISSSIAIHSTATIRVMSNARLNCAAFVITGGNFDNQSASTLGIGSTAGITSSPAAFGNIQTTNRTYLGAANYIYNGVVSQATGDGLPTTHTGILEIANTGIFGNNTVTLSSTGSTGSTLVLTSGLFAIGTAQQYNMSAAGTVTTTAGDFATGTAGGTLNFNGSGSFTGNSNPYNVFIAGAVNFGAGNVTIQNAGTFRINVSGSVNSNAPLYATNSILQYNINGNFNRGLEWSAAAGKGFPYHVQLSNNTVLNAAGAAAINAALPFVTAGNVTVDAGATLSMNFGGNNMTVPLTIGGNLTFAGSVTASGAAGGNISLAGNWTNNGAVLVNFTPNNRLVTFNGSGLQTIGGSNTTVNPFDNVTINNAAGVTLAALPAIVQQTLTLTLGTLNLNSNVLTIGTIGSNGAIAGGSSSSYIISGNVSANLIRYTTTNNTTYVFPVGDATHYTPMTVQFFAGAMNANTQVTTNVIPSVHPNNGTSPNYLNRYWQVEPINIPSPTTAYGVTYTYDDVDIVGTEANLKPMKHNASGWIAATGSGAVYEMGTGSVNPGTNTVTWSGLTNFSDFTGNGNGSPLPISLLNFDVKPVLNTVEINWSTATETNNDYFTVEKSINAIDFTEVAIVDGAGNSNELLNYRTIDKTPYNGVSYYRLKQTDFDGRFTYSDVNAVQFNVYSNNSLYSVFPNPSKLNGIYLQVANGLSQHIDTKLYDVAGKLMFSETLSNVQNTSNVFLNFETISDGIYFLEVTDGTNKQVSKIVLSGGNKK